MYGYPVWFLDNTTLQTFENFNSGTQGSVLGPLLFLIFINDMLYLPMNSLYYCFIDDTKFKFLSIVLSNMQADLDVLGLWSADHELNFNASKCGSLPIGLKHRAPLFLAITKSHFLITGLI